MSVPVADIVDAFRDQAQACRALDSPWTARVLELLILDLEDGGPCAALLADWKTPPRESALALRVAGAINALVLAGRAPRLAPAHPLSANGGAPPDDAVLLAALRITVQMERDYIAAFIAHAVQTNEVQRSAILTPGFLTLVARNDLPLSLLEIGASGGLNQFWDRYAYRFGEQRWGPDDAALVLTPGWSGPACPMPDRVEVLERRAVDIHPLDFRDDEVVQRGMAFIWPDQPQRLDNFRAAVDVLRASTQHVEQGDAGAWLTEALSAPLSRATTVIFHSVMWQYLSAESRAAVTAAIHAAGVAATPRAPLAWLRFEPRSDLVRFELTLEVFTGAGPAVRERLAWAHPHGASIRWLAEDDPERWEPAGV
ncbi:MAG TPA: DUF2332 domain-containing protein [Pseudomonadales bacterium]|nr:DUF2332 domain-containing protein [Pseudomonadales bacterium]